MLAWLRDIFAAPSAPMQGHKVHDPRVIDKIRIDLEINDGEFSRKLASMKKDVEDFDKLLSALEQRTSSLGRKRKPKAKRSRRRAR